jgi:GNAT superfamily N-acetyltransferase
VTAGVQIRAGGAADAAALAGLRLAFRSELAPASEPAGAFIERCARWMAERLDEGQRWHCWLAESDSILGAIWVQLLEKIPNPAGESERHAYVTNFYVVPAARGLGLGSQMLGQVLAWCRHHGVDAVLLWPSPKSRPLYSRHGFRVDDDLLTLRLGSPDEPRDRRAPQDGGH